MSSYRVKFIMYRLTNCLVLLNMVVGNLAREHILEENSPNINIVDLSKNTSWKSMLDFYSALEKRWKICLNCGVPGLGTTMHLDYSSSPVSMHPAAIPVEFLLTRLSVIDVSSLTKLDPALVLTLDVALQWITLKYDPKEPTLLLFKFGWVENSTKKRTCVCETPGLSYELAEWIAANMSHVVGISTDAPTLESEQTREFSKRTVANVLGQNDSGCMAMAMPLMLQNSNYVPTRLTAFCPTHKTDQRVMIALKKMSHMPKRVSSRVYDVNLEEIMN